MSRAYCWLTLCPLWDWLGSKYDGEGQRQPMRTLTGASQMIWFQAHNNRVYRWLDTP